MEDLLLIEKLDMEDHFTSLNAWDASNAFYPTERIQTREGRLMMKGSENNLDYLLFGVRTVNDVKLMLGVKVMLEKSSGRDADLVMRTRVEVDNKNGFNLKDTVQELFPNFAFNASDASRVRHEMRINIPLYLEYLVPMATDIAFSTFLGHLHQFRGMEAIKSPDEVKEYFREVFTKVHAQWVAQLEGSTFAEPDTEDDSDDYDDEDNDD